ncbi:MAG: hypothetical protein Q9174_006628, partial [Haloplaca sp. 1 TL-2023]
ETFDPPRQAFVQAFVDGNQVFSTNVPTGAGNFKQLTGSFTAGASGSAALRFQFTSTEFTTIQGSFDYGFQKRVPATFRCI